MMSMMTMSMTMMMFCSAARAASSAPPRVRTSPRGWTTATATCRWTAAMTTSSPWLRCGKRRMDFACLSTCHGWMDGWTACQVNANMVGTAMLMTMTECCQAVEPHWFVVRPSVTVQGRVEEAHEGVHPSPPLYR